MSSFSSGLAPRCAVVMMLTYLLLLLRICSLMSPRDNKLRESKEDGFTRSLCILHHLIHHSLNICCYFWENLDLIIYYQVSKCLINIWKKSYNLKILILYFFLIFIYLFIYFYFTILVLPHINMNPPRAYACSPSWTPSHHPPRTIPPGHPSAPAPSILYRTCTGDSFLIWYYTWLCGRGQFGGTALRHV